MSKANLKRLIVAGSAMPLALLAQASFAAVDVTSVTAGITDAGTGITTVVTALMGLSVSVFGIVLVYNFVKRRAGA